MAKSYTGYTVPLYLLTVMHGLYSSLTMLNPPPLHSLGPGCKQRSILYPVVPHPPSRPPPKKKAK